MQIYLKVGNILKNEIHFQSGLVSIPKHKQNEQEKIGSCLLERCKKQTGE